MVLAGCNLPSNTSQTPTLNVTQAYQTVEARLTQAIALTPATSVSPSATQGAIVTQTPSPPTAEPSLTPTQPGATSTTSNTPCDQAAPGIPIDVTIPDGTEMQPGQAFTKIWRLQNVGTCTWTKDYALVWFSGDKMGAPSSVPLNGNISPGQTVDLSVDMVAPEKPGTYRGNWKLRNDSGVLFGIGPSGGSAFWVEIEVLNLPTSTTTTTPPSTATPTVTPTVGVQVSGSATLVPGDRLDLDTNQINPGSGEDLALETSDENLALVPLGSAALAVFGSAQPTLNDCQTIPLSGDPLVVEGNLSAGTYLCYRTNMALPGWGLVTGFDPDSATLSLDIFTWSIP
jgi:hypothetical protein